MNIFPKEVMESAKKMGGEWITAAEFEEGLVLQIRKTAEIVEATNPKYGAVATDYLVKKEILEEGCTLRYFFTDTNGKERQIDSKSAPLFIAFQQVEDLEVGEWVKITRTGKINETRFTVEKTDTPSDIKGSVPF